MPKIGTSRQNAFRRQIKKGGKYDAVYVAYWMCYYVIDVG